MARPNKNPPIPNKIYCLWLQGRENAPELVRINFDRWERLNPDYELVVLDKTTAQPYLADFPIDPNKLTVQAFSDILRVRLLAQNGGIWTDATVYPVNPLSNWLHTHMEKYTFFIYEDLTTNIPLASSFIAARKDCPIIKKWHDLMCQYWFMEREPIPKLTHNDPFRLRHYIVINVAEEMGLTDMSATPQYPYWWLHHLVAYLLETDAEFRNLWETIDKPPSSDHFAVFEVFYIQMPLKKWLYSHGFINQETKVKIQNYFHNANMQKLDWREKYPLRLLGRLANTPHKLS